MKLVFLSNYYTHHQAAICTYWHRVLGGEFTFVETEVFSSERQQLGWSAESESFVHSHIPRETERSAQDADALILGSAPIELVLGSLKRKQIVFKYSERVFKRGYQLWKWIPRLMRYWYFYGRHKSLYLLCASAYTYRDYAIHGAFIRKSYKWGYFPETKRYDLDVLMRAKQHNRILWCGRFLRWKHPEIALMVAERLHHKGYDFEMDIIGMGDLEQEIAQQIVQKKLSGCVHLWGTMSPEEVRCHMERAGIYLFTSNFQEGWGAVLNEAMNSGCATVASHAIGAVPYLIKHGENGLIYENGCIDGLYNKVQFLLDHPQERHRIGENAYRTITELWNGEVAAERFVQLVQQIQKTGKCELYDEGPCSRAEILKNDWFREELH